MRTEDFYFLLWLLGTKLSQYNIVAQLGFFTECGRTQKAVMKTV